MWPWRHRGERSIMQWHKGKSQSSRSAVIAIAVGNRIYAGRTLNFTAIIMLCIEKIPRSMSLHFKAFRLHTAESTSIIWKNRNFWELFPNHVVHRLLPQQQVKIFQIPFVSVTEIQWSRPGRIRTYYWSPYCNVWAKQGESRRIHTWITIVQALTLHPSFSYCPKGHKINFHKFSRLLLLRLLLCFLFSVPCPLHIEEEEKHSGFP